MFKIKPFLFSVYTLCFVLVLLTCNGLNAQQIIWAQLNNIDKKTDFTKVIGQNKHGVYVLKHKNSTFRKYFIIERFDKRMNLMRSKIIKIPNAELQKIVVLDNDIVFFTKVFDKGYTSSLHVQHLDTNLNIDVPTVLAAECDLPNANADFKIEYSENRKQFLAWYLTERNNTYEITLCALDNFKKGTSKKIEIAKGAFDIDFVKASIDIKGNFYCIYTESKNSKANKATDFQTHLLCVNLNDGMVKTLSIHNPEDYITYADLCYNSSQNTMIASGFYGKNLDDEVAGYFSIQIAPNGFELITNVQHPINRKTVSEVIGIKAEARGDNLSKFKIRKTIPKTDGGQIIIAERSFVTNQSDVFYVNGIAQTSYSKIFNNDEVLILSIDSTGELLWDEILFKNQLSTNDGGYNNGIVIMVNEDNFNIIYNDKLNANADVIQVTFNEKGERTKKILINSDQYYALVIPAEYNQVTSNSAVLPINQNRDYTYIKLLY